jgi:ribosomal protein S26
MANRGKEKLVRCEKCGRQIRKDKAVYIDKVMLSNPLERNQVQDEQYTRVITREVCYCISCGKHGRIFEKKKLQVAQQKERNDYLSQYGSKPRPPALNQYAVQRNTGERVRPPRPPRMAPVDEPAPAASPEAEKSSAENGQAAPESETA